jgi:hypothetical protein
MSNKTYIKSKNIYIQILKGLKMRLNIKLLKY